MSVLSSASPDVVDVLPTMELDLKRIGTRTLEHAKGLGQSRSICEFKSEMVEGNARNVLCEVMDRHGADILAVGSHGYGAIKSNFSLEVRQKAGDLRSLKNPRSTTDHSDRALNI